MGLVCKKCGNEVKLTVVTEEKIIDSSIDDPLDGDLDHELPEVRVIEIVCVECGESTDLPPEVYIGDTHYCARGETLWSILVEVMPELQQWYELQTEEEGVNE